MFKLVNDYWGDWYIIPLEKEDDWYEYTESDTVSAPAYAEQVSPHDLVIYDYDI